VSESVEKRYDAMIQQIAKLHERDPELAAWLRSLRVNRELWDPGRGGGHFYFEDVSEDAGTELVDVVAEDADGASITVTLHLIGLHGNWAEWYRWDGEPVLRWPPPSVRFAE
jgi:hypothetical protein